MSVDISILGDKRLQLQFNKLEQRVGKAAVKKGLLAGARIVRDEAKRIVAVKTGKLKKSIKAKVLKPGESKGKARFGAKVITGTRAELDIKADAAGYYPAWVEFGGS